MTADDALTGTWSPDRQIAIAGEPSAEGGVWHCFFRDQRTGADLGDIPLHDPRPTGGEVLMRAAWNFPGTRIALLIHYAWDAEELRLFCKDDGGRMKPAPLMPPDPVRLYRQHRGEPRPKTPNDYAEAGLGPWTDDDTIEFFIGEARPDNRQDDYVHYYAEFEVHFRGQRARMSHLRLKAPLTGQAYVDHVLSWQINYCNTHREAFGHAPDLPALGLPLIDDSSGMVTAPADRAFATHDYISKQSDRDFLIKDGCDEYRADFGHFPSGNNRDILRQLVGLNSRHKTYLGLDWSTYDRQGNAIDQWNEPYIIDLQGKHADMFARRHRMARTEQEAGQQWPSTYDPLYHPSKADRALDACYQLALGIRLATQRDGRVPTAAELSRVLFDPPAQDIEPIINADDKRLGKSLRDPWGSRYRIELAADHVSIRSTHLPGEVWTEPFAPVL